MSELELEQQIHEWIRNHYKAVYVGLLTVEKTDYGYCFSIGIPSYLYPTIISCEYSSDEDFLNFIYEELRTRNYMRTYFYNVTRTPIENESNN